MTPEFSRPIILQELEQEVSSLHFEAEPAERTALANRFGLLELKSLTADVTLTKQESADEPLRIDAKFSAQLVQECVISLEPVPAKLEGSFACTFTISGTTEVDEFEIEVDPEAEDPPEILVDGQFDAGELIAEHFGLHINPFPKAEGAVFDASKVASREEMDINNPFAMLEKLKDEMN